MKNFTKRTMAFLLAIIMAMGTLAMSFNVNAAEKKTELKFEHMGPCTLIQDSGFISLERYDVDEIFAIYAEKYNATYLKFKNISYDKETNTLTLDNFVMEDMKLRIYAMGDDFKILLKGENKISSIFVTGGETLWGGSLMITGTGSLEVNSKRRDVTGIKLDAGKNNKDNVARFYLSGTASLKINVGKNYPAIFVLNSKKDEKCINLPTKLIVNEKIYEEKYIKAVDGLGVKHVRAVDFNNVRTFFIGEDINPTKEDALTQLFYRKGNLDLSYGLCETEDGRKVAIYPMKDDYFVSVNRVRYDFDKPIKLPYVGSYQVVKLSEDGKEYIVKEENGVTNLYAMESLKFKPLKTPIYAFGALKKSYKNDEYEKLLREKKEIIQAGANEVRFERTDPGIDINITGMNVKENIKGLTATEKGFKITLNQSKRYEGYIVFYATKKDFSDLKYVVTSKKTTTIKNLKAGKKYYVMTMPYRKTTSGLNIYGVRSDTKTVTTKK